MSHPPCQRPLPHARLDPINSFSEALWLMMSTIDTDVVEETVLFSLDDTLCGLTVAHLRPPQNRDVIDTIDWSIGTRACPPGSAALIVGSVRPGGGAELDDHARWEQIDEICDAAGIELVEWIVLGANGVTCPRELTGEPSRWGR